MAQSLARILIHAVFSTKDRYPYLQPDVRPELHAYTATVLKGLESPAILVNSVDDHVHLLCSLSKILAACDLIQKVKTSTSKWLKTKGGVLAKFRWQNGYGAFSVSPSQADSVRTYIENQESHHKRVSYQDELRRLLAGHGLALDERYAWD